MLRTQTVKARKAHILFARLAKKYSTRRWAPMSRSNGVYGRRKTNTSDTVTVQIISAITGEKSVAKSYEDSKHKLKVWLKLRNLRAQFYEMPIAKNSTWAQLTDVELKDYPVLVKVGTYSVPYLIDHVGFRIKVKGKEFISQLFLKTVDNINYLSIVSEKKKLVQGLPKPKVTEVKIVKKKRKKVKRNHTHFNEW